MTLQTIILLAARLIIAGALIRTATRNHLTNLYWLTAFFVATSIGDIAFNILGGANIVFGFMVGAGEICMAMFIHDTFYRDRKSPLFIFLAIAAAFWVADVYFGVFSTIMFPPFSPFNWLWLIVVSAQSYRQIASTDTVEPWIKSRYQLVTWYSVCALAAPMVTAMSLIPPIAPYAISTLSQQIELTFVILGIALEFLAWVMPGFFKAFLNRNYHPAEFSLDVSEEEIMRQFNKS